MLSCPNPPALVYEESHRNNGFGACMRLQRPPSAPPLRAASAPRNSGPRRQSDAAGAGSHSSGEAITMGQLLQPEKEKVTLLRPSSALPHSRTPQGPSLLGAGPVSSARQATALAPRAATPPQLLALPEGHAALDTAAAAVGAQASGGSSSCPEEMRRTLSRERRYRRRAEKEVVALRAKLGEPPDSHAVGSTQDGQRLTWMSLARHEIAGLAQRRTAPVRAAPGATGANGAEVLRWKLMVKQSERRMILEEIEVEVAKKMMTRKGQPDKLGQSRNNSAGHLRANAAGRFRNNSAGRLQRAGTPPAVRPPEGRRRSMPRPQRPLQGRGGGPRGGATLQGELKPAEALVTTVVKPNQLR